MATGFVRRAWAIPGVMAGLTAGAGLSFVVVGLSVAALQQR